jgi:Uma2 family endonuclease
MVTTRLMTAEELAQLPDNGRRYVLLQGELIEMAPPDRMHAKRQGRLVHEFIVYADKYGGEALGESGFVLEIDPDTVLAPDASYTRPENVPAGEGRGFGRYAPDVAAEIDSPSNRPGERRRKVIRAYHAAGTRIVLFVNDEKRTVTVEYADGRSEVLREGDVFDGGNVMPGFRLPVTEFFR